MTILPYNIKTIGTLATPEKTGSVPVYNAAETQAIFKDKLAAMEEFRNSPAGKFNLILNWAINASDDSKEPMYRTAVEKLKKDYGEKYATDEDVDNIIEVIRNYLPNKVPLSALLKRSFVNYFPFHPITQEVKKPTLTRTIIIAVIVVAAIAFLMFYFAKKQKL